MTSCMDKFLEEGPQTSLTPEQVYTKVQNIEPTVLGLYDKYRKTRNDRLGLMYMMGTDESEQSEAQIVWETNQAALDTYSSVLNSKHVRVQSRWNAFWPIIVSAASSIYGLNAIKNDDTGRRDMVLGEACFLRAAAYYELVSYWGGVPMIDYEKLSEYGMKRQPEKLIYEYIISDLETSVKYLPHRQENKIRACKYAAMALLSKVYMSVPSETGLRDFKKAEILLKRIIDEGGYTLVANYNDLYSELTPNTSESIYEFQYNTVYPNNNMLQYQLGSRALNHTGGYWGGYEAILPTTYCAKQLWEPGDLRYQASIRDTITVNQAGNPVNFVLYKEELGPHIKKYEDPRVPTNTWYSGKNVHFLRYADVLLMYAECLNENDKTSEAISVINENIRKRAWGGSLPADKRWSNMSKDEFRVKILDERMRELCFEGWRRLDLIRTGKFVDLIKLRNKWAKKEGKIQAFHMKYPIPDYEIRQNDEINPEDQNPGYL